MILKVADEPEAPTVPTRPDADMNSAPDEALRDPVIGDTQQDVPPDLTPPESTPAEAATEPNDGDGSDLCEHAAVHAEAAKDRAVEDVTAEAAEQGAPIEEPAPESDTDGPGAELEEPGSGEVDTAATPETFDPPSEPEPTDPAPPPVSSAPETEASRSLGEGAAQTVPLSRPRPVGKTAPVTAREKATTGLLTKGPARKTATPKRTQSPRRTRWKRRGMDKERRRIYGIAAAGVAAAFAGSLGAAVLAPGNSGKSGPDGPFAQAVAEVFPEALARRIEVSFREIDGHGPVPAGATLPLPAYLLAAPDSEGDAFRRLGREFGIEQGMLSGPELGARIERIASASLPPGLVRCQTYEIGDILSDAGTAGETVRLRALHIHLNPGC